MAPLNQVALTTARRYFEGVMGASLAATLADITLPDADGTLHRVGDLWKTSPAVLVFLRHYG